MTKVIPPAYLIAFDDLVSLAHAARMHYDFLKKMEGSLPEGEARLRTVALAIEASAPSGCVWQTVARTASLLLLTVALWATVACQDLNKYVYTVNYVCTGETWPVYTATVKAYGLGEAWTRIKAEGELVCGLANVNISTNIIADSPTPEAVK